MGIRVLSVHQMEYQVGRHLGVVSHNGQSLSAVLVGSYEKLMSVVNQEVTAEYELNEVFSVEIDLPAADELSGFFPETEQQLIVDGTLYNEVVIDDQLSLFDLYIRNGADFVWISSNQLPEKPKLDARLRIHAHGLVIYPKLT